jgi:acetoin utilization deacetylase AcuC-like enzyme
VKIFYHPLQQLHDPKLVFHHGRMVEQPDGLSRYATLLETVSHSGEHRLEEAAPVSRDALAEIHNEQYLRFLETAWERWQAVSHWRGDAMPSVHPPRHAMHKPDSFFAELGWYSNSSSCAITERTWTAVQASAWCAIAGAKDVAATGATAYALCRPPGHHAYADMMSGLCYLNNASLAANELRKTYRRVAILDVDAHHGDGTQAIFMERDDVIYGSIHVDSSKGFAPYYSGFAEERGVGEGLGFNMNVPLAPGVGDEDYLRALGPMLDWIDRCACDALVVSFGTDIAADDPLAVFTITENGFSQIGRHIKAINVPTVIVQEGGYAHRGENRGLSAFLAEF